MDKQQDLEVSTNADQAELASPERHEARTGIFSDYESLAHLPLSSLLYYVLMGRSSQLEPTT